jgi:type II secretion system protein G
MTRRRGFTLIELLIVVAIIGIIVAIAVVNMINAIQRAKQKRSMGDMKSIATAIEAYAIDQNVYPAAAGFTLPPGLSLPTGTLGAASASLAPTYLRVIPLVDGWNSFFTYGVSATQSDFILRSGAADGALEVSPVWGGTTNFNADIILVDGTFVQFPEGAQR